MCRIKIKWIQFFHPSSIYQTLQKLNLKLGKSHIFHFTHIHLWLVTPCRQQFGEFSHYYRPEEIYHYRYGYLNHILLPPSHTALGNNCCMLHFLYWIAYFAMQIYDFYPIYGVRRTRMLYFCWYWEKSLIFCGISQ